LKGPPLIGDGETTGVKKSDLNLGMLQRVRR